MNSETRKFPDSQINVRPMVNAGDYAGWPGYVVEVNHWEAQTTELAGWFPTFGQADALRVALRIEL
jgi:hypothetical protein